MLEVPITSFSHQHYERLSAADGHALISVGTADLTLTIQGLKIPHTFNVVKQLNYDIILGVSFFTDTQAYIDFGNNTISICDVVMIEPLVSNMSPTNVIRTASNVTMCGLFSLAQTESEHKAYSICRPTFKRY